MRFLYPQFLYFLPVVVLPILLYLFKRLRVKTIVYPSIEIIQEIVKEKRQVRINFFIKQLLKFIILLILILSFAHPVVDTAMKHLNNAIIIIDPTYSMKEFNLFEIISFLRKNLNTKIYLGTDEYKDEVVYSKDIDLVKIINKVSEKEKASSILLITDGQKVNFERLEFLRKEITNLMVALIKHSNNNNIYFKDVEIFPVVFTEVSEINIKAALNTEDEFKIILYVNDKPFSERNVKKNLNLSFMPDKSMLKSGENLIKLEIVANDFKFDNQIERRFYFIPDLKVYIDRYNFSFYNYIKKVLKSLFGSIIETDDPKNANLVFLNNLKLNNLSPTYIFPEKSELKKFLIPFITDEKEVYGEINSKDFPALNLFKNLKLKTLIRYSETGYEFSPCVYTGSEPVIYKSKNTYLFTFSVSENLSELSQNPFLPVFIYETLSSFYIDNKIINEFPSLESSFEFYSANELSKKIKRGVKVFDIDKIKEKNFDLKPFLVILCFLIFVIEAFFQ